MKERSITDLINEVLVEFFPTKRYRPVPSAYGARTIDYIGSAYGYSFVIEAKRPGLEPTELQALELEEWHQAGAACFAINNASGVEQLRNWLQWCKSHPVSHTSWPTTLKPQPKMLRSKRSS